MSKYGALLIDSEGSSPVTRRLGYTLAIVTILNTLNFLDRQILTILSEPIKAEFRLADWQIGIMTGFSFAILYSLAGFPIARWAERGDRVRILSVAAVLWSLFTAACGFAQNLTQFLLARVGVGIGEAGCTPAAHSLLCEVAPLEKRASTLAIYTMGAPLGALAGMALGGVIASYWGWRAAMMAASVPGIVFAAIAFFTLPEPRRRQGRTGVQSQTGPGFWPTIKSLFTDKTYMRLTVGNALTSFVLYGSTSFLGSFYLRNHLGELGALAAPFGQKPIAFLGLALGLIAGIGGVFGAMIGGKIGDRWVVRDKAALAFVPALGTFFAWIALLASFSVSSVIPSMICFSIAYASVTGGIGVFYAGAIGLISPTSRATASALMLFVVNIVGLGLGPLTVGLLSDIFSVRLAVGSGNGLRLALIVVTLVGFVSSAVLFSTRQLLRERIA